MGEPAAAAKALMYYSEPKLKDIQSSIVRPAITANTFEIKPSTIQLVQNSVQFGGASTEDPNMHMRNFIEICDTFKINGVSEDAIKLRLFPFSLRDKAKGWLHSLPVGSILTWEDLAQKFLTKFFPMAKTAAIRNAIIQFSQQSEESLCEAWERYKEMLRKCPHHGMPDWMVINCFYNGLGAQSRPMLDAASGGALWAKSYEEAYELIEMMAANEYQNSNQRLSQGKIAGILEVNTVTALAAQLEALNKKLDFMSKHGVPQVASVCELCEGAHETSQCAISSESAQFVSNFQQPSQPASAIYHPNFGWSNNQDFQQQQFHGDDGQSSNEKSELDELRLMIKSQAVYLKTLENQFGQIASAFLNGPQGVLPSDTVVNPGKQDGMEQVNAITLRSGNVTNVQNSAIEDEEEIHDQDPTEKEEHSVLSEPVVDSDEEEECESLGLADLWDSKVLINEVVSWSNLEDSEIESFLEKNALLEYESNKDLHELYRNFTSDEMFEELNAICSTHEIHLEERSFDPKSVAKTSVGEPPTSVTNPSISTLGQSLVVHNENHHVEEAFKLKLKPPDHLRYDYLGQSSTLLIIIVANFSGSKKNNVTDTFEEQGMLKLVIEDVAPEKIIKWPYTKVTWHVFGLKIYYGGAIDRQSVSIILADV